MPAIVLSLLSYQPAEAGEPVVANIPAIQAELDTTQAELDRAMAEGDLSGASGLRRKLMLLENGLSAATAEGEQTSGPITELKPEDMPRVKILPSAE